MGNKCDQEVFDKGYSVATLDACMHRAEQWVQEVAQESGQRVDWHYYGGIANVLYLGDHAKVLAAVEKLRRQLKCEAVRYDGECGSCSGPTHRLGRILSLSEAGAHGPYRAGDEMPPGVVAVDTH